MNIIGKTAAKLAVPALVVALAHPATGAVDTLPATMDRPAGFPDGPITIIVPYGEGGGSAQVTRAMAAAFTELTDVPVKIEYIPGGSGTAGLQAYMARPTDGMTVLQHIDDATSAFASGASPVNPAADLVPLVTCQITFNQIYVRANEDRFSDWTGFLRWVHRQDGEASVANVSRRGAMERVLLKQILDYYSLDLDEVSFDKADQRYTALDIYQVDALIEQPGDVRRFLENGLFKPILTLLPDRSPAFPDVPAMKDVGLDIDTFYRYRGFYAGKRVPPERLAWLQWAFQKAYFSESFQAFNRSKFMDAIDSFRDTRGSVDLINRTAHNYRRVYQSMGLIN